MGLRQIRSTRKSSPSSTATKTPSRCCGAACSSTGSRRSSPAHIRDSRRRRGFPGFVDHHDPQVIVYDISLPYDRTGVPGVAARYRGHARAQGGGDDDEQGAAGRDRGADAMRWKSWGSPTIEQIVGAVKRRSGRSNRPGLARSAPAVYSWFPPLLGGRPTVGHMALNQVSGFESLPPSQPSLALSRELRLGRRATRPTFQKRAINTRRLSRRSSRISARAKADHPHRQSLRSITSRRIAEAITQVHNLRFSPQSATRGRGLVPASPPAWTRSASYTSSAAILNPIATTLASRVTSNDGSNGTAPVRPA